MTPIKVISRQKAAEAQARGIGEIFSQMEEARLKGSLKVVNGMPNSDSQNSLRSLEAPQTMIFRSQGSQPRSSIPDGFDGRPSSPSGLTLVPHHQILQEHGTRLFVPSFKTVEKAVAAKVFFEQHYCPSHLISLF